MYSLRETLEMVKKLDAEKKGKTENISNSSTATGALSTCSQSASSSAPATSLSTCSQSASSSAPTTSLSTCSQSASSSASATSFSNTPTLTLVSKQIMTFTTSKMIASAASSVESSATSPATSLATSPATSLATSPANSSATSLATSSATLTSNSRLNDFPVIPENTHLCTPRDLDTDEPTSTSSSLQSNLDLNFLKSFVHIALMTDDSDKDSSDMEVGSDNKVSNVSRGTVEVDSIPEFISQEPIIENETLNIKNRSKLNIGCVGITNRDSHKIVDLQKQSSLHQLTTDVPDTTKSLDQRNQPFSYFDDTNQTKIIKEEDDEIQELQVLPVITNSFSLHNGDTEFEIEIDNAEESSNDSHPSISQVNIRTDLKILLQPLDLKILKYFQSKDKNNTKIGDPKCTATSLPNQSKSHKCDPKSLNSVRKSKPDAAPNLIPKVNPKLKKRKLASKSKPESETSKQSVSKTKFNSINTNQCIHCKLSTESKLALHHHLMTHKNISCNICSQDGFNIITMSSHIWSKHELYYCYYCDITMPDRQLMKEHCISEHSIERRVCHDCPQLLTKFSIRKHKKAHEDERRMIELNKPPTESNKQDLKKPPENPVRLKICKFCDEKHNPDTSKKLHLESCSVKMFYDESIFTCAKYKWQRFDIFPKKLKLEFHGFDDSDLVGVKNPYDFYFANGKSAFKKLESKKEKFILGYNPFPAQPRIKSWQSFAQMSDSQTFKISIHKKSKALGVYGEDKNLSGFSCSFKCPGKSKMCLKEMEEHLRSVHNTAPRFYCKLCQDKNGLESYFKFNNHLLQTHGGFCESHNVRFSTVTEFHEHMKKNHLIFLELCYECEKLCWSEEEFKNHEMVFHFKI